MIYAVYLFLLTLCGKYYSKKRDCFAFGYCTIFLEAKLTQSHSKKHRRICSTPKLKPEIFYIFLPNYFVHSNFRGSWDDVLPDVKQLMDVDYFLRKTEKKNKILFFFFTCLSFFSCFDATFLVDLEGRNCKRFI